ncbi:PE domain-containing protein [Rhodococcus sp. G-MC3]|uniref:PE domain-containing protein n=1 Tax=Rhodococcus sp. G-MC3 TaxID=3046209 RepID=UPI0024B8F010|nr:PE domain-containing protein [Rhodococcus sp. G-MC3]MDJ0394335.1 PE domain-containing protein [Rhodococcus sp. G-MC3]
MPGTVRVDPVALEAAAADLDAAAARLQASLAAVSLPIQAIPSGSEEVSLLANRFFRHSAGSFSPAAADAINELIETASALRAQASAYRDVDFEHGRSLGN